MSVMFGIAQQLFERAIAKSFIEEVGRDLSTLGRRQQFWLLRKS